MSATRFPLVLAAGAVAATLACPFVASASERGDGGSRDLRDAYTDQLVGHPQYIEPGGQNDPARYRIGDPSAGYYGRQAARAGEYETGYGLRPIRRGRVVVQPYRSDFED